MSEQLKKLVQQVQEGAKYRFIHKDLVENIARNEITSSQQTPSGWWSLSTTWY